MKENLEKELASVLLGEYKKKFENFNSNYLPNPIDPFKYGLGTEHLITNQHEKLANKLGFSMSEIINCKYRMYSVRPSASSHVKRVRVMGIGFGVAETDFFVIDVALRNGEKFSYIIKNIPRRQ